MCFLRMGFLATILVPISVSSFLLFFKSWILMPLFLFSAFIFSQLVLIRSFCFPRFGETPSSFMFLSAIALRRFGTRFTLWLAVRLLSDLGTLWKARRDPLVRDCIKPDCKERISYAREDTKAGIESMSAANACDGDCLGKWVCIRLACGIAAWFDGCLRFPGMIAVDLDSKLLPEQFNIMGTSQHRYDGSTGCSSRSLDLQRSLCW